MSSNLRLSDVRLSLAKIEELAESLRNEVEDIAALPYSNLPGPEVVRTQKGSHTDPVGDASVANPHIKAHYRRGASLIAKAYDNLRKAHLAFGDAVKAADKHEDDRDPEGRWGRPIAPPLITKSELKEARAMQQKRRTG